MFWHFILHTFTWLLAAPHSIDSVRIRHLAILPLRLGFFLCVPIYACLHSIPLHFAICWWITCYTMNTCKKEYGRVGVRIGCCYIIRGEYIRICARSSTTSKFSHCDVSSLRKISEKMSLFYLSVPLCHCFGWCEGKNSEHIGYSSVCPSSTQSANSYIYEQPQLISHSKHFSRFQQIGSRAM